MEEVRSFPDAPHMTRWGFLDFLILSSSQTSSFLSFETPTACLCAPSEPSGLWLRSSTRSEAQLLRPSRRSRCMAPAPTPHCRSSSRSKLPWTWGNAAQRHTHTHGYRCYAVKWYAPSAPPPAPGPWQHLQQQRRHHGLVGSHACAPSARHGTLRWLRLLAIVLGLRRGLACRRRPVARRPGLARCRRRCLCCRCCRPFGPARCAEDVDLSVAGGEGGAEEH